jgi:hypothetical protein
MPSDVRGELFAFENYVHFLWPGNPMPVTPKYLDGHGRHHGRFDIDSRKTRIHHQL